jgi:hypothetical protein
LDENINTTKKNMATKEDGPELNSEKTEYVCVGFEVLTPVVMNSSILCDITPCIPLKVNRSFGGTYLLLLQG